MSERQEGAPLKSDEQLADLIKYLEDAEFASAKYIAYFDFVRHTDLENTHNLLLDHLSKETDPRSRLFNESQLRMTEFKMALLENEMEKNKSRIPSYDEAELHIYILMDSIQSDLYSETGVEFPEDEKRARAEANYRWKKILKAPEDMFFQRANTGSTQPSDN